jgi:D-cysteine desulfhydrase family pyridoxal phosphate-dependent enzyme
MNKKIEEARKILENIPKVKLGFFPTPFQRMDRLSERLGVEIYLKRDDLTGISQFGGNKIRKLEYLMADVLREGADTVITYGASQSNHAMQTVTACRRLGLHPVLYLTDLIGSDENNPYGNLLLDRIMGAEIHLEPSDGDSMMVAEDRIREKVRIQMERLKTEGRTCYEIPMGGANVRGSLGFLEGYVELMEDLQRIDKKAQYLYHATGTGGTMAGLLAGKMLLESETKIRSIGVGIGGKTYNERVMELSNAALDLVGCTKRVLQEDIRVIEGYYGEGYEVPSEEGSRVLRLLAETEGIFLDPVYTAKAFSGMLDHIKNGIIEKESTVVFWHTGGATALFAEKKILGRVF